MSTLNPLAISARPRNRPFYGWRIVGAALVVNVLAACLHPVVFSFFIGPMSEGLAVSRSTLSWGVTLRLLGAGVCAPLLGLMIDRWGPRWLGTGAALLGGVSIALLGTAQHLWFLYLLFFVSGMVGLSSGSGGGGLLTVVPVAKWFVRQRNRAMAIAYAGTPLGIVLAIPIASGLIGAFGWQVGWLAFGIGMALATPLFALIMRRAPEDLGLNPDGDRTRTASESAAAPIEVSWSLVQAVRTPVFWMALLAFCAMGMAINGTLVYRVQFWKDTGLSSAVVALATTLDPLCVLFSSLFFGLLAGKVSPRLLGITGGLIMASAMLPMIFASQHNYLIILANVAWGTGAGAYIAANNVLWPAFFGRRFLGSIRGVVLPFSIAAAGLSAPLYGYLLDAGVNPKTLWLLSLSVFLLAVVLFLAATPPRHRTLEARS